MRAVIAASALSTAVSASASFDESGWPLDASLARMDFIYAIAKSRRAECACSGSSSSVVVERTTAISRKPAF